MTTTDIIKELKTLLVFMSTTKETIINDCLLKSYECNKYYTLLTDDINQLKEIINNLSKELNNGK